MTLNPADTQFAETLKSLLPERVFAQYGESYRREPRGKYVAAGGLLLKPENTQQISQIVTACNEHAVGIVPYGGGTGLVGGQVMPEGPTPVVLSLERMNGLRGMHVAENVMVVEAGMILADAQAAAETAGRLYPLSLASEGSCQIGGNLSTNAGGVQVVRYGNARDLCLGLEAVLPDGTIWNGLTRLRKDNTGYDLRNLLIGAEGTLGVITAATLKLVPRSAEETAALVVVRDPAAAIELLGRAQEALPGMVTAFELIHRQGFDFLAESMPEVRLPFDEIPEWSVLIDIGAGPDMGLHDRLETLLMNAHEEGLAGDMLVAQNEAQRIAFWAVRENIPEANRRIGSIASHDISVPISEIPTFIDRVNSAIAKVSDVRINCFGHVGDGNLHYNFYPAKGRKRDEYGDVKAALTEVLYEDVAKVGGSISAEHGIGRMKVDDLVRYGDPAKVAAIRAIKAALDPKGIMNPGAVVK